MRISDWSSDVCSSDLMSIPNVGAIALWRLPPMSNPIKLDFSEKYDEKHAHQYLHKHQTGLSRRLSHRRDEQLARTALALAGDPGLVLDLPCGAGRLWPVLAEKPNRVRSDARRVGKDVSVRLDLGGRRFIKKKKKKEENKN